LLGLLLSTGCASLFGEQSGLKGEQLERIEGYRAEQAHDFAVRFAGSKVDVRAADLQAIVSVDAINTPLQQFKQRVFKVKDWQFTPTHAPVVELSTGSAILRITGDLQQGDDGRKVEVTVVSGLSVRWSDDGSHLYFKPSALAVVPTLHVSWVDFALGSSIRSFAEDEAAKYLRDRVGEIDVPINLMLPIQRAAIDMDQVLDVGPEEPGARMHYGLPEATAQVRLKQLYVWPLEGKLVVLAYADVQDAPAPGALPQTPVVPQPPAAAPSAGVKP
jgi:hypothetical protein